MALARALANQKYMYAHFSKCYFLTFPLPDWSKPSPLLFYSV